LAADVLELLPEGVLVVEADGRVRGMNNAARRLLAENGGLSLGPGGLEMGTPGMTRELCWAIEAAARGANPGPPFRIARDEGPPLSVRVLSLESGQRRRAAVFVKEAPTPEAPTAEQIMDRFGTTPMESKVAHALARGAQVRSIAQDLGIAVQTVRGHLKQVFSKTGAHRQAEVVALLLSAPGSSDA
jgi:DNA-binding NarL/FixJ family response regulator